MTNYDSRDDDKYDNGKKDGNDKGNAVYVSVSNGTIFDAITMLHSYGVGLGDNGNGATAAAHYISTHLTIYLPYKDPIKNRTKTIV